MSLRMEGMDIFEGDVISRELSEYHEKNGGQLKGVAVTSGGQLLCKYLLHVAGPENRDGMTILDAKERLYKCVKKVLEEAERLGDI